MMQNGISNAIIYQINLRSLAAREPRNAFETCVEKADSRSPLVYVCEQLPLLKSLGVTVLHLMPPFLMGHANRKGIGSPYAIQDYLKIDPEYGTRDALAQLARTAHALGFKMIVGMVPNHTSRDHPWTRTHSAYYVKTKEGTIAYDADWSDTAKLDYTHPALRRAMIDIYDHLERRTGSTASALTWPILSTTSASGMNVSPRCDNVIPTERCSFSPNVTAWKTTSNFSPEA